MMRLWQTAQATVQGSHALVVSHRASVPAVTCESERAAVRGGCTASSFSASADRALRLCGDTIPVGNGYQPASASRRAVLALSAAALALGPPARAARLPAADTAGCRAPGTCVQPFTLPFRFTPAAAGAQATSVEVHCALLESGGQGPLPTRPLVLFTAGFLTPPGQYVAALDALLSLGASVLVYDQAAVETLTAPLGDEDAVALMRAVWAEAAARQARAAEACAAAGPGSPRCRPPGPCFLMGHSRGGKVSRT
jgi:hypothetical protein